MAQKVELNSKVKPEDKLKIKYQMYISAFLICNMSFAVYYVYSQKQLRKSFITPIISVCYLTFVYQLYAGWEESNFIKKMETEKTDVAYYFRSKIL